MKVVKLPPQLTKEDLAKFLPEKRKGLITDEMIDFVNAPLDSQDREAFKQNLIQFIDIYATNEFRGISSLNFAQAVLFVTYRLLGNTVVMAWQRVFPDRFNRLKKLKKSEQEITNYAIQFGRGKLVSMLMERSMIPVYILNMDLHQEAINTQAHLMRTAKSENVRMKAAECLINVLMPPQVQQHHIQIDHNVHSLEELKAATRELAIAQKASIIEGRRTMEQVAEGNIIDVTPENNEDIPENIQ